MPEFECRTMWRWTMTLARSSRVSTACTPGRARAAAVSTVWTTACGCGLRTKCAWSAPSTTMSSTKRPRPRSSGSSSRRVRRMPMLEAMFRSDAVRRGGERVFHIVVADRADQLGDFLDAALVAPRFEVVDDGDQRGGIAERGIADADGGSAREHVFHHVLGLGHAADADDRNFDGLRHLVDHPQHDRLQRRRDQAAELVAERRPEIVG